MRYFILVILFFTASVLQGQIDTCDNGQPATVISFEMEVDSLGTVDTVDVYYCCYDDPTHGYPVFEIKGIGFHQLIMWEGFDFGVSDFWENLYQYFIWALISDSSDCQIEKWPCDVSDTFIRIEKNSCFELKNMNWAGNGWNMFLLPCSPDEVECKYVYEICFDYQLQELVIDLVWSQAPTIIECKPGPLNFGTGHKYNSEGKIEYTIHIDCVSTCY